MKKRIPCLIISTICSLLIWGQNTDCYYPNDYSIIPPSPEVASLMKHIDFPMATFTGQPVVNLPIYTIKEGTLEVPISISYHGGGIKVNELSGYIGIGWSLNAGGCISRSVHGLPDELNKEPLHGLFHLTPNEQKMRDSTLARINIFNPIQFYSYALPSRYCNAFNAGRVDMANDIFNFNFLGHSGTFIINPENHHIELRTSSNIDIPNRYRNSVAGEYVFVDELQTRYIFNSPERTRYTYVHDEGYQAVDTIYHYSAWHLDKIISVNGDTVSFHYTEGNRREEWVGTSYNYTHSTQSDMIPEHIYYTHPHTVSYYPQLLTCITTKSIKVDFDYDANEKRIIEISVYRRTATPELVYRYRLNSGERQIGVFKSVSQQFLPVNKRFLNSITQVSPQESEIELYSFNYYSDFSENVDYYLAQDHWGYYNGANNNTLLTRTNYYTNSGANRSPDVSKTKNGVLTSISYATGGTTYLNWEQNDYSFIRNATVGMSSNNNYIINEFQLYGFPAELSSITDASVSSSAFDRYMTISVPTGQSVELTLDISTFMTNLMNSGCGLATINSKYYYTHTQYDSNSNDARVEIRYPNGTLKRRFFIDHNQCSQAPFTISLTSAEATGTYTIHLKNPYNWLRDKYNNPDNVTSTEIYNYLVKHTGSYNVNGENGFVSILTKTLDNTQINYSKPWGGLRISSIRSSCGDSFDIEKTYTYKDSINPLLSSGTIWEGPYYESQKHVATLTPTTPAGNLLVDWTHLESFGSDGLFSFAGGIGSHVEYPSVLELIGNGVSIRHTFDSMKSLLDDDVIDCPLYGYISGGARMLTSQDHKTGNLIRKEYFSNGILYQCDEYDYNLIEQTSNLPCFTGDFFRITDVDSMNVSTPDNLDIYSSVYETCRYRLIPYNKRLGSVHSTELKRYMSSGGEIVQSMENEVNYTYFFNTYNSNPHANLIRSESHLASDGKTYITYYTYLHRQGKTLALRETEVTMCEDKIISSRRNVYDSNCRLVGTYRGPTGMSNSNQYMIGNNGTEATEALKNVINLPEYSYQYDNGGNIVEISYNGVVLASYLWGYKGSHPIAEIKGVPYSTVNSVLPDGMKPHQLLNRYDLTPSNLSAIISLFPANDVTTMTYDWLVGVGTMTDARGVTTYYNYDDFGRLKDVKDLNGYFIRKYDYHYQIQN